MEKAEYVKQCNEIIHDRNEGIITQSDCEAYLDDLDLEYQPSRYTAEVNQVTSRGTRTDLR